jgi:cytosine/adenosine deaminase-related metal-dependent hydrolase
VTVRVVSAPWVLPGLSDAPGVAAPPVADGAVALDGGRVIAVGRREAIERRHGAAERLDAILLPALVNAHLHLELSHLAGKVPGGDGLAPWIGRVIAARAEARADDAAAATAPAAQQLRAAGVAAVGDISNTLASLEPLARAGFCGTVFHEVLGFTRERFERYREAARAERGVRPVPRGLLVWESPHAVYSTHREALLALLRAGPGSLHLAEDPAERELCRDGTGPLRTMLERVVAARAHGAAPWVRGGPVPARPDPSTGAGEARARVDIDDLRLRGRSPVAAVAAELGPRHLAVHCVDLDPEDVALLAASGATAVLCPRSNRHISGLLPPLSALLEAGVPLAVGTDSLASAPSLTPLAELALLRRAFPAIPAARLLPLAWNGAAVGAPHVGRLAPGPAPGVVAAPLDGARPDDPFEFLLGGFGSEERPLTWIAANALEPA